LPLKENLFMGYRVSTEMHGRHVVHLLHDDASGASASILPSHGFNLFDLRLPVAGKPQPIVVSANDFAENPRMGAGNGNPILFPYPNRVRGGSFTFKGKTYALPVNNGANSIHGFAANAAWRVLEHGAGPDSAFIVGAYQISLESPELTASWPTDAVIEVRYDLAGRRLTMTTTVSNPTAEDLPYGFGIHPYFRLPFPPGGSLERTRVVLPASQFWVLDEFLPTGEIRPVDDRLDFRQGRPMTNLKLDDVLTSIAFENDRAICRLQDLEKQAEFQLGFDRGFRELVVYTPPSRPDVIALEPYTQATDAVNLQARGISAGLRVLKHDERDTFTITMATEG
jgi:aldose 1-epimerase